MKAGHERCGTKYRYPDWDKAVHAALVSNRKRGTPLRVYQCELCQGFHLTKRPTWTSTPTSKPFTPADLAQIIANRKDSA